MLYVIVNSNIHMQHFITEMLQNLYPIVSDPSEGPECRNLQLR